MAVGKVEYPCIPDGGLVRQDDGESQELDRTATSASFPVVLQKKRKPGFPAVAASADTVEIGCVGF